MHQMMALRHLANPPGDGVSGSGVLLAISKTEKSVRGRIPEVFLVTRI